MRKSSLFYILGTAALLVVGIYGCKRVNGINNNTVIQTPYSLYFGDSSGAIYCTNNGKDITRTVFKADGKPTRALATSGNNILFAKNNLYFSSNEGVNFNHSYDSLRSIQRPGCNPMDTLDLNQSMMLDLPDWNKLYTLSATRLGDVSNYFGLAFNDAHGQRGHWYCDGTYDTTGDMGTQHLPMVAISMTRLTNGVLCVIALDSSTGHEEYIRNIWAINESGWVRWHEKTGNPDGVYGIGGLDQSGTPLPPYSAHPVPGFFSLGHFNNRLIAIDKKCLYGAYYSDDTGKNWKPYSTGLPANTGLLCIESPFEEVCLVGTQGKGLYMLNTHTNSWEPSNRGLGTNISVRSIAGKKNIYKNGTVQKYIYLATDQGIYQSADGGLNWTKTVSGNFVTVF